MSSNSDSDDDLLVALLDGRGQSSLSNILCFIWAEGEQSSSSAGEARGTGQRAAAPDPNKVLVELEKIQSSLRSMESRVKSATEPPKRSQDLSGADRCPSPSGIYDLSTWDEEIRDLSNGLPAPKLSENSMATVASSLSLSHLLTRNTRDSETCSRRLTFSRQNVSGWTLYSNHKL